jgi:TonB-linked SusC/RagA family outer membrane protein
MFRPGRSAGRAAIPGSAQLRSMARAGGVIAGIVALMCISPPRLSAQSTGRITGVVTDSASGRPVGNVQVLIVGTRIGSSTDAQGRYTITGAPAGTRTVEARRIGYRAGRVPNVNIQDGATATVDIRIIAVPLTLQAVVTTGVTDPTSGTRVPFTVGRVEVENIPVPSTNAIESIQGKVAAVTIVPSGQPGSGTNIMLRSPTSINKSNAPLIVVDGVVQSTAFGAATADLEAIDIESVEIIKGAAAASLYGSRAQSGVIQITTKRGSNLASGSTRFTARSEWGNNELAGQIDWARYHYYATNASGGYVNAQGRDTTRVGRVARPAYQRFQDVAYSDPVYDQVDRFFDPGQFSKNSFNIAQNMGRTNWFLSLVNTREDGVVLGSGEYNQNDARLNLDHLANAALSFAFSGYHSRSDRNELYGDTFFDLINQAPDINLLLPDPDGTPFAYQLDHEGREENPLYVLATEDDRRKRARTQGSLQAKFTPLRWLTFDGSLSYDRSDRRTDFFLDQGIKTEGFALGGLGEIAQTTGTTSAMGGAISANLLGYWRGFTMRSTMRAVVESEENEVTTAEGSDFSTPGVRSLNNAKTRFVSSNLEQVRARGYFISGGADYAGRYIADLLVRRDGSSLFGPEERWNTYYRFSGAYRLSEEPWWRWRSVNELKLRFSRGTAGGRPSFNDQYETFAFAAGGGVSKQNLGNRFLKPERTTETEMGVDAIWKDRYSIQVSRAETKSEDQLIQIPLPAFFGFSSQWQNAGTVKGNTIEGTLEAQVIQGSNLQWRVGLIADRSRHKITEFNRPCFQTQTIAFRCAGVSLGEMYGFRFIRSTAELPVAAAARASEFDVNDEGLLVWVGLDGSGQPKKYTQGETPTGGWGTSSPTIGNTTYGWGMPIKLRDSTGSDAVVRIGEGTPDFHWGVSNNVSWKSWDFYALVDANVGGHAYNQTNQRMYQWARSADVDQAGKPQELKKPIEYYVALYSANDPTDYFVEDASFVKVREVSLRYRITGRPLSWFSRFGATGASISLIGRNLMTFTNYKGYDPEVGGTLVRLDSFDYPRYRTFTGSIEFIF